MMATNSDGNGILTLEHCINYAGVYRSLTACFITISMLHPFAFFLAKGWESTNLDRPFSDLAVSSPGVALLELGNQRLLL
jgi:hypothetical protein